jgi:hypothetical protein
MIETAAKAASRRASENSRVVGQPLLVTILDRTSGELAAMLPLVLRTDGIFRTNM